MAKSFFHTLKTVLIYQHCYRTSEEARLAAFEYIAPFYNRSVVPDHGYRSPADNEAQYCLSSA